MFVGKSYLVWWYYIDVASMVVWFTGKVCVFLGFGLALETHDDVWPAIENQLDWCD